MGSADAVGLLVGSETGPGVISMMTAGVGVGVGSGSTLNGCAVGIDVGSDVGSAVGSDVDSAVGSDVGVSVGSAVRFPYVR